MTLPLAQEALNQPWWISVIKAFLVANLVLGAFAYLTWVERKLLGRMQLRYGPNRTGPFGLLQPIADLIKLLRKASFFPAAAVDTLYIAAPAVAGFTALAGRLDPAALAGGLSAAVVVGQLRSAVVDLLEACGVAPDRARAALPASH